MINTKEFSEWLKKNTTYSDASIGDVLSRIKRADKILKWTNDSAYLYYLGETESFKALSLSIRSQLRKAVKLYSAFYQTIK